MERYYAKSIMIGQCPICSDSLMGSMYNTRFLRPWVLIPSNPVLALLVSTWAVSFIFNHSAWPAQAPAEAAGEGAGREGGRGAAADGGGAAADRAGRVLGGVPGRARRLRARQSRRPAQAASAAAGGRGARRAAGRPQVAAQEEGEGVPCNMLHVVMQGWKPRSPSFCMKMLDSHVPNQSQGLWAYTMISRLLF